MVGAYAASVAAMGMASAGDSETSAPVAVVLWAGFALLGFATGWLGRAWTLAVPALVVLPLFVNGTLSETAYDNGLWFGNLAIVFMISVLLVGAGAAARSRR